MKFKETSIIASVYTEDFGMQSYIVNGIRSARSKKSLAYFQPMMLLDLVVYHKSTREIQRLSEWKSARPLQNIYSDIGKSTIALFLSEVIYKTIKEQEPNQDTFAYIFHSIEILEEITGSISHFHLQFMVKLARYLGFGTDHYISSVSDLHQGIVRELSNEQLGEYKGLNNKQRAAMLEYILLYFRDHVEGFGELRSYPILKELFHS